MRINLAITWLIIEAILLALALANPSSLPSSIAYTINISIIIILAISLVRGDYKASIGIASLLVIQAIIAIVTGISPIAVIVKPFEWLIKSLASL